MPEPVCVNLREMFGEVYQIRHDPVCAPPKNPEEGKGSKSDPWLYEIPCRWGTIYPHSDKLLAFECTARQSIPIKLDALGLARRGWDTWLFSVEQFCEVAAIVHPRKRRRCHLSPEELQKRAEKMRPYRFAANTEHREGVQTGVEAKSGPTAPDAG